MSKTPIPCIVGFGGITPAGRASHNLSHTRVTYSLESEKNKQDYIKSVLSLCNMADEIGESQSFDKFAADKELEVLQNTLVRKIDKEFIREKFLKKYQNLETKFKKSEFIYLLVYRFIGGIPWQISCLLPTLFNVRVSNFFFATLIGIIPQIFLAVSIGSGLEKIIDKNSEVPGITEIIFSPDIYIPLIAFFSLILVTIFLRKIFYKN